MSPFLYLAFFKTILPALFRTFGLPSRFWPSKPSFLHDHFTTQHLDFSIFLSVPITYKPVNRSIHAYALTWLNVFVLRGLFLYSRFLLKCIKAGMDQFEKLNPVMYRMRVINILGLDCEWNLGHTVGTKVLHP